MANIKLREKAIELRNAGNGINEIAKNLNINKSTVSYWCKNIKLSPKQLSVILKKQKNASVQGLLRYMENIRVKRFAKVKELNLQGEKEVGKLTKRELFLSGVALYWAEGYKKGNDELGFTNSDPLMIKFFTRWLKEIYGVEKENLILRVSINIEHSNRMEKVINFWSNLLNIPPKQFTKTSLIKTVSKKKFGNQDNYFGTLRVKVRKGTNLRRKIEGSIKALGGKSF